MGSTSNDPFAGAGQVGSEFRDALREMVGQIRDAAAALAFVRGFMECLSDELATKMDTVQPNDQCSRLDFTVRGGQAESTRVWLIDFWKLSSGEVAGRVSEHVDVDASALPQPQAGATVAKVTASSFRDLIDIAARRRSPMAAVASRRIQVSGDVIQAVRALGSVLQRAAEKLITRGPNMAFRSAALADAWLPDEASDVCMVCRQRWVPFVRHRHHCRQCGTLVCGRCSTSRHALDGLRRCVTCIGSAAGNSFVARGVSSSMTTSVSSFSFVAGRQTTTGSMASAAWNDHPHAADCSHSSEIGVLNDHIEQKMAPQLRKVIEAVQPSERELRMWDRLLAADTGNKDKPGQALASSAWRVCLCAVVFAWSSALEADLPTMPALMESALSGYPDFSARICIALWTFAFGLLFSTCRWKSILLLAVPFVGRWLSVCAAQGQLVTEFPFAHGCRLPWFVQLLQSHPFLCTLCGLLLAASILAKRRIGRAASIYLTAFVPIFLYWSAKRIARLLSLSEEDATKWLYRPLDECMGPYMANRFLSLGGLFVKLGQWVSNASAFVPVTLQEHLKTLVDQAVYDDADYVRNALQTQLGQPLDAIFEEIDLKPIASASIAQVHKGTLKEGGQPIALKLQHKDIKPMMLFDLQGLSQIIRFCCWLGGDAWKDMKKMYDTWAKDMVKELDFMHEVENLREVREGLTKLGVDVIVPKEIAGWTSGTSFAMEFCEGFRFTDRDRLALYGVDRAALGARALHAAACQLLEVGIFNSDPHAGNLLCQVRGNSAIPVLLDFGNCIRLTDQQRLAYCRLIVALCEASVTKVREALDVIGLVNTQSGSHPERDLEFMLLVFRDTASREKAQQGPKDFMALRKEQRNADMEKQGANTKAEKKKAKKQVQRYPTQMPDEFVLFMRMVLLVRGLCMQLDAELPLLQIFEWHARRALASAYPVPQRALALMPPGEIPQTPASAKFGQLRMRVRESIGSWCEQRPGLGIQVCVDMDGIVVDECGGVLGATDPRPVARSTLMPLGDMAKLPLLLLLFNDVKAGKAAYSTPLEHLFPASSSSRSEVKHALAHRALACPGSTGPGDARQTLASTSAKALKEGFEGMCGRISAAFSPSPLGEAAYLPIGAGYAAALACGIRSAAELQTSLSSLSHAAAAEIAATEPDGEAVASVSSSLFADMRGISAAVAVSAASSSKSTSFLGNFGSRADKGTGKAMLKSGVASMLDVAGGLLVDPALGAVALKSSFCPDLGVMASARALAKIMNASAPADAAAATCGQEPCGDSSSGGLAGALAAVGLAPRAWDERGFEVRAKEPSRIVGLSASGGLMGLALQWQSSRTRPRTTVVILTNELSISGVPNQVLQEICSVAGLPCPDSLASR